MCFDAASDHGCGMLLGRQPFDLIRCVDGFVYVMRIVPKDELFVMIERPDLLDEGLTVDIPTVVDNVSQAMERLAQRVPGQRIQTYNP